MRLVVLNTPLQKCVVNPMVVLDICLAPILALAPHSIDLKVSLLLNILCCIQHAQSYYVIIILYYYFKSGSCPDFEAWKMTTLRPCQAYRQTQAKQSAPSNSVCEITWGGTVSTAGGGLYSCF